MLEERPAPKIKRASAKRASRSARQRLADCLPSLSAALEKWGGVHPAGMTIACATPRSSTVLWADGWAEVSDRPISSSVTAAIARAIESPTMTAAATDAIVAGLSLALGSEGRAQANRDAAKIVESGRLPLVVLLCGDQVIFVTLVEVTVPPPTFH